MNPGILVLFIVPLVETWVLIRVGHVIGAVPTIALVVLTAVIGSILLKRQGISTIGRMQAAQARGEMPAQEMLEGVVLLIAGVLLLTPGFFTDLIGFSVLIPKLRAKLVRKTMEGVIQARPDLKGAQRPPGSAPDGKPTVIEGEYERRE